MAATLSIPAVFDAKVKSFASKLPSGATDADLKPSGDFLAKGAHSRARHRKEMCADSYVTCHRSAVGPFRPGA